MRFKLGNGQVKTHSGLQLDWTVDLIDTGLTTNTGGRIKRLIPYMGNETFLVLTDFVEAFLSYKSEVDLKNAIAPKSDIRILWEEIQGAFVVKKIQRGSKTICVPMFDEQEYQVIVENQQLFRQYLDEMREEHPEIFPSGMEKGYSLYGIIKSSKLGLRIRRIQLKATKQIYQVRPSFVMPYMIGQTEELEKPLYLRRFGVPYEALAYVFGQDPMYWYRATAALGRFSLIGTTVKDPQEIPEHLVADEKHSWLQGERVYLPTTAAKGCILGVDVVENCNTQSLTLGYQTFRDEALNINSDYQATTVNTDGWEATQQAWQNLFPKISIIACFLHLVLSVQRRCRRNQKLFTELTSRLGNTYRASTKGQFSQRLRRLLEWGQKHLELDSVKEKLLSITESRFSTEVS